MPAGNVQVTVTADTGPGQQITGQVLPNVREMKFRFADGAVDIYQEEPPRMLTVQYSNLTTVTFTPASRTVVLSDV